MRVLACIALIAAGVVAPAVLWGGIIGSPHDFSETTGPFTKSRAIAPSGSCSACHLPHWGDSYSIWARNLEPYRSNLISDGNPTSIPNYVPFPTIQCYDCHDYHSGSNPNSLPNNIPATSYFNSSHLPQNIAAGFTLNHRGTYDSNNMDEDGWGGSVSGYYENNPPFATHFGADPGLSPITDNADLLRTGGHYFKHKDPKGSAGTKPDIGDKLPCRDCHDPHEWNSNWQAFIKPNLGGTVGWGRVTPSDRPTASGYMANEFTTSGARSDSLSRTLCIACHGNSNTLNPVDFRNVNPDYDTAAGAIVRPPDNVAEHRNGNPVACVACHNHNSVDASCTDCHGEPVSPYPTGKNPETAGGAYGVTPEQAHARHHGYFTDNTTRFSVYSYDCKVCHANGDLHQNNNVEVVFDFVSFLVRDNWRDNPPSKQPWTGSNYTRTTCANVYCHSLGYSDNSVDVTIPPSTNVPYFRTVTWGTPTPGCNGCHATTTAPGTMQYGMPEHPSDAPGTARANSHVAHVVTNGYECTVCHYTTVSGTYAARVIRGAGSPPVANAYHANGIGDVIFDGTTAAGASDGEGGYHHDNDVQLNKRCNVSCHGTGKPILERPQWGGSSAGCFSCHNGVEQTYKPQIDYGLPGNPNPVDNNEYLTSGHGRSSGVYPGDNNAPANFGNYSTAPADCYYCHSQNAAHGTKDANDPFRLGAGSDTAGQKGYVKGAFADNTDALCLGCHGVPNGANPQGAKEARTQNMLTHARGITGMKYASWPVTPWKCVDCHDPHGDTNWKMVRSAVNAPTSSSDSQAGSNSYGSPKRVPPLAPDNITFTSVAGQASGSYASLPTRGKGPCEICHNQNSAFYNRAGAGAAGSHATRTSRCTGCHPHKSGFAATACEGCHGGENGELPPANGAPKVTRYWKTSGHGRATSPAVGCTNCHDVGSPSPSTHTTTGSGTFNTYRWNGDPNDNTTANTPHLQSFYMTTGTASQRQIAFDAGCYNGPGGAVECHAQTHIMNHRHTKDPSGEMRFGRAGTRTDPKAYTWYTPGSYETDFYMSRSPWVVQDVTTEATDPPAAAYYGICASCHDPHGTATTDNTFGGLGFTNHMVRGNYLGGKGTEFCSRACHK